VEESCAKFLEVFNGIDVFSSSSFLVIEVLITGNFSTTSQASVTPSCLSHRTPSETSVHISYGNSSTTQVSKTSRSKSVRMFSHTSLSSRTTLPKSSGLQSTRSNSMRKLTSTSNSTRGSSSISPITSSKQKGRFLRAPNLITLS
jgi:hypothetical protein